MIKNELFEIKANAQFNSNEVYFETRPTADTITALKALKLRWNPSKKCWYGFASAEDIQNAITGETITTASHKASKATKKASIAPLWERCDFSNIPDHNRHLSTKEIAAQTRSHLKERFPEVKFSVTIGKGGWASANEINAYIVASPYSKGEWKCSSRYCSEYETEDRRANNEPLQAILDYCTMWLESFNYDNSDPMTDYFDVNFYGDFSIDYHYTQTEASEEVKADIADFETKRNAYMLELEAKRDREFEEYCKKTELQRIEAEKREKEAAATAEKIENHVVIVDIDEEKHLRINGLMSGIGKECSLDEVKETIAEREEPRTESAEITRKIFFKDAELFNSFCKMFLYDFNFLAGFGGTATDDCRVTSENFCKLNSEQRNEVKFYICKAVAVYFDDKLQFVIDPEGYNYARYVLIPTEEIEPTETEPDANEGAKDFYFPAPIAEQAENIKKGSFATLLHLNPWTLTLDTITAYILDKSITDYAQYKNSLKLDYITGKKQKYIYLHDGENIAVFNGLLPDVPKDLLYRQVSDTMQEVLFSGSFAKDCLINCIEWYKAEGFEPLIDTIQR